MKLIKQFSKYAVGSLMVLLTGLITTPILTRLISTVEMGKYSMFFTIGSLIASIIYLGLDQSYVRYFYEEEENKRVELLNKCLKIPLLLSIAAMLLITFFYKRFSSIIVGKDSFLLCVVFGIYLIGLVIDKFWMLKFRMSQMAGTYSALNVLRKLSYLLFAVLLFYTIFGDSYWTLITSITIAEFVLMGVAYVFDKGNWKSNIKELKTSTFELLKYGFPFIFSTTITLIFHSTDKLMLNSLSDYNQIGIYAGAQSIVSLLTHVQTVFTTFWIPVAYEHYSKNPEDKAFFVHVNEIISYCMLIIAILLLCTKDLIILFLGAKYRDAVYVFPFLSFMPIMYTVSETTGIGINFLKRSQFHIFISTICAVVNAVCNYFLIIKYGAKGAAISTGIAYIVFFVLRTFLSNKVYPVNYKLLKFYVSCIVLYAMAIYASFTNVTFIFVLFAIVSVFVISLLYKSVLKDLFSMIKNLVFYYFSKRID